MERLASAYGETHGWRTVIGRLTNLYGPGQDLSKGQGLISTLVNSAITLQPATIYVRSTRCATTSTRTTPQT